MNLRISLAGLLGLAFSLSAADSAAKDEVLNAAKKLAAAPNYSWRSTTEMAGDGGGGGRMRPGPTEGRAEKDGVTQLTMTRGDTTTEAFLKADKSAVKTAEGWKTLAELSEGGGGGGGGGQRNPGRFLARTLTGYKAPAVEAQDLAGKVKELTQSADAWTGELPADAAKELLSFGGRRGGGNGPSSENEKASVKFWVKEGVLSKYELHVQGTMSFNGNTLDVDRTTTVEIKDVGSTKITVPEDAQKKLS